MMTKDTILRCIKELESNLAKLRKAVEKLPAVPEPASADILSNLEQEEIEDESNSLDQLFAIVREQWNIPPDIKPEMPLEEIQKAMAQDLPENWASREILRMREE
jgi:hypothetical protein